MRTTNDFWAHRRLLLVLTCGLIAFIGMGSLGAQDSAAAPAPEASAAPAPEAAPAPAPEASAAPAPAPAPKASAAPSVAEIEALLAAVEADTAMEAALKVSLKTKYSETIENLKKAEADTAQGVVFRSAIESAPAEATALEAERRALPAPEDEAKRLLNEEPEDLKATITSRQNQLKDRQDQLEDAKLQLERIQVRPGEIASRRPLARTELSETETKLAASDLTITASTDQVADRLVLQAKRQALNAEIGMLDQENSSLDLREGLIRARRDLLLRQVENDQAATDVLVKLESQVALTASDQLAAKIAKLLVEVGSAGGDQALKNLIAEMQQLPQEHKDTAKQLIKINEDFEDTSEKLISLTGEFERIEAELALGGLEGTFGQILAEMRRRLPNANAFAYSLEQRQVMIREMRLAKVRVERKGDEQLSMEVAFAQSATGAVVELVEQRGKLLNELRANYGDLERKLTQLDAKEREYRDKIIEVRDFLQEETFFSRSSGRVDVKSFTDIPAGLRWFAGLERWQELGGAALGIIERNFAMSVFVALVVILLVFMRPRLIRVIAESGKQIKRISTDRYLPTFKALVATGLLALPVPLVLIFAAWGIGRDPQGSDWLRGLSRGLHWSGLVGAGAWFLAATCRRAGLGIVHFGWSEEVALRVRRSLVQFLPVYLLGFVIISSFLFENSAQHFDSLGRHSLNIIHLWMAFIFAKLLRPSDGIFAGLIKSHPRRMIATLRYVWFPLVLLFPFVLVVLACLGFVMTALVLSLVGVSTLAILAGGVICYYLVLRWFMIKERKLALERALEQRRARRAAAGQTAGHEADESLDAEEPEIDLEAMGQQTRRLLRSLSTVSAIASVWLLWSHTLPITQAFRQFPVIGDLNLLELIQAVLVAVVFSIVVRNLPGLLELGGLRAATKDAGTSYAISQICQYGLTAIGVAVLFNVLGLDWSKFGWIATGLSVGIGFGMQEIVANFICGIILLFERPVRVGDVVSLDNVTGTVTRIRMRATTITNYDRQEYVVPNKQLITGTFINWTLTNSTNRIVISVGIAYGSDTTKALQILRDVANDHPRIMDDPAPLVTFDQFADSTLNLTLRCYLPDLDGRAATISVLNEAIDDRFKKAGIEIAFPQQDLHLRTISPSVAELLKANHDNGDLLARKQKP